MQSSSGSSARSAEVNFLVVSILDSSLRLAARVRILIQGAPEGNVAGRMKDEGTAESLHPILHPSDFTLRLDFPPPGRFQSSQALRWRRWPPGQGACPILQPQAPLRGMSSPRPR